MWTKIAQIVLLLVISPFLFGIINRTKAVFAGRKGIPWLQLYSDIFKLFRKGAVYSPTTTWIFRAGPIVSLSSVLAATLFIPFAGHPAVLSFDGDIVLFIYLLALGRFFTVLAALDTGSSFEGMGASREVQFAVFAEPALFLNLMVLARITGEISLSGIFSPGALGSWSASGPLVILVIGALFIIFLTENSRMPVDDPNTHLELTMIHEVMVLDHGGVDFAYILYAGAIKFWLLGSLLVGLFPGGYRYGWAVDSALFLAGMALLAVLTGTMESILARLRLLKIPQFIIIPLALSVVALLLTLRR